MTRDRRLVSAYAGDQPGSRQDGQVRKLWRSRRATSGFGVSAATGEYEIVALSFDSTSGASQREDAAMGRKGDGEVNVRVVSQCQFVFPSLRLSGRGILARREECDTEKSISDLYFPASDYQVLALNSQHRTTRS